MKKLVRSYFLLLFLLLVWGAQQARAQNFCEPPACPAGGIIDISTGIDNRQGGVPLPIGQIDPHWQVTAGPTGPGDAFVFDTGNFGFAQQANWISFDTRGLVVPFTDEWYTFERCFCNCNEPIEIFDLEVIASHTIREVRIDNQVIYQNPNRPIPFSPPVDAFAPVPMPPWSTIGAGRFCIEIDVWAPQENPVQTPLGLSVTGSVQGAGLQLDECCSAEPAAARIVGRKYHDQNCNGTWDAGEPPLAGWRFELFQNGNLTIPVSVTTSDANGNFVFPNLGLNNNYVVRERVDLQPGWRVTAPNPSGDWAVTITQFADYEVNFGNCEEEPPNCCNEPEPVLVLSENFEGSPLFFSEYQNGTAAVPGQYQVTNQVGAANLSNNRWDVQGFNLNNCNPSTEQFLLVNGRTGGTGEVIVYESPSVHNRLVDGQTYRVCVRVKHLPICAFDVVPQVQLELRRYEDDDHQLFNSQPIWQTPLTGVTTGTDPCDYLTLTHEFTYRAPTGEDEEDFIGIRLDESASGDGNDLAIDEFQLQEVTQVAQTAAGFTLHESDFRNGTFRVDAISTPLDPTCEGRWEICILDDPADANSCRAGTFVSSPYGGQWGANTAFNGYCCTPNAGASEARFDLAEVYFIRRYVECDCQDESEAYYKIWEKRSPFAPITILYDGPASGFPGNDDPIH